MFDLYKSIKKIPTLKLGTIILIASGCLIAYRYLIGMLIQIPSFSKYAYAFNEEYGYSINYLIMHLALKIPFSHDYTFILSQYTKNRSKEYGFNMLCNNGFFRGIFSFSCKVGNEVAILYTFCSSISFSFSF